MDVGANDGHYGAELREHGYRGRIVSFEPVAAVYDALERRTKADPLWHSYRLALGDANGEQSIAVSAASVFSSFKPLTDYTAQKFVGAREARREQVEVQRLDSFLGQHREYLNDTVLKIDTQGFEKEVLTGAGSLLQQFRGLQLELPLKRLYEGQDTIVEMVSWLNERGFEIVMAKENGFDYNAVRLLELDVVLWRAEN